MSFKKDLSPLHPRHSSASTFEYQPLLARTFTLRHQAGPVAYDCVKLVIIRKGSALVYSEFGERFANIGDVLLLGANVLCGARPEGGVTVSVIYLDTDYVLDQVFWQYADLLQDRFSAQGLAEAIYTEPAQLLRLGEDRVGKLMPWLDELVTLSVDGMYQRRFHRMQALWYSVMDEVAPFVKVSPVRTSPSQRSRIRPTLPRGRKYSPLRDEARSARDLLVSDIRHSWSLPELADAVHLSATQLVRVFTNAYGKTPLAYLTMLGSAEGLVESGSYAARPTAPIIMASNSTGVSFPSPR